MLDRLVSRLRYELGNPRAAANARLETEQTERTLAAIRMLGERVARPTPASEPQVRRVV